MGFLNFKKKGKEEDALFLGLPSGDKPEGGLDLPPPPALGKEPGVGDLPDFPEFPSFGAMPEQQSMLPPPPALPKPKPSFLPLEQPMPPAPAKELAQKEPYFPNAAMWKTEVPSSPLPAPMSDVQRPYIAGETFAQLVEDLDRAEKGVRKGLQGAGTYQRIQQDKYAAYDKYRDIIEDLQREVLQIDRMMFD